MSLENHPKSRQSITHCGLCKNEIQSVKIRCVECSDLPMCLECFVTSVECPDAPLHKRNHPYTVEDNLAFPVYEKDWAAEEELMLLDGIEMYGLGNWRDVAGYVGTKTEAQCSKHYATVYLAAPAPGSSDGVPEEAVTAADVTMCDANAAAAAAASSSGGGSQAPIDDTKTTSEDKSKRDATSTPVPPSRTGTGGGTPGYPNSHVPKTDVSGYLPLRGDFDIEHDNDAEAILADMDFVEGEHVTETELKLKILEIYNATLDERERRKAFVLERGLLDYKRILAAERRKPREEREIYDAFRPFARFQSPAEHEDLVRGIIMEHRLRKRIAQLQEYRKAGIRSLAEAQDYEAAKRRKEASSATIRRQSSAHGPASSAAASVSSSAMLVDEASGGTRSGAEASDTAAMSAAAKKRRREGGNVGDATKDEFSIAGLPGTAFLQPNEVTLCEYLHLFPEEYRQIKSTIINLALARGIVKRSEAADSLVHVDVAKVNGVYDFCISSGWAVPEPLPDETVNASGLPSQ